MRIASFCWSYCTRFRLFAQVQSYTFPTFVRFVEIPLCPMGKTHILFDFPRFLFRNAERKVIIRDIPKYFGNITTNFMHIRHTIRLYYFNHSGNYLCWFKTHRNGQLGFPSAHSGSFHPTRPKSAKKSRCHFRLPLQIWSPGTAVIRAAISILHRPALLAPQSRLDNPGTAYYNEVNLIILL